MINSLKSGVILCWIIRRFQTFSCLLCCLSADWLSLSHQDDSDEEPSTADQTPEHDELMEYVSLSCEDGEETTSSEV